VLSPHWAVGSWDQVRKDRRTSVGILDVAIAPLTFGFWHQRFRPLDLDIPAPKEGGGIKNFDIHAPKVEGALRVQWNFRVILFNNLGSIPVRATR